MFEDMVLQSGCADKPSQILDKFEMRIMTSPLAQQCQKKDTFETLSQIRSSLSSGGSKKKIRHSLKNLCFYNPWLQTFSPLLSLFKSEIKDQSVCFRLLAFHVINHAPLIPDAPDVVDVVSSLEPVIVDFSKPAKRADMLFRVFFHLCKFSKEQHDRLVNVLSKILSIDMSFAFKKKKKSLVGGKVLTSIPDLIHESTMLLNDLPDLVENGRKLMENPNVVRGLQDIFKAMERRSKIQILLFVSKVVSSPMPLRELCLVDETLTKSMFAIDVLVSARDQFQEQINSILEKQAGAGLTLLLTRLIEVEGPSERIEKSLLRLIAGSDEAAILVPLLKFLVAKPMTPLGDEGLHSLYMFAEGNDQLTAFYALMCIALVNKDERDWIVSFFSKLIEKLPYTQRCAVTDVFLTHWKEAITFECVWPIFFSLLRILLVYYGDSVGTAGYADVVNRIVAVGATQGLIYLSVHVLNSLPSMESVMLILYSAGVMKTQNPPNFGEFQQVVERFVQTAGPALASFYESTL